MTSASRLLQPSTFHPFTLLPIEIQLLILAYARSTAISALFPSRYVRQTYSGYARFWKETVRTGLTGSFKVQRSDLLKSDGLGALLGVNQFMRNETLSFLEKRWIRGQKWSSVWRDQRVRQLRKWSRAVYMLEIGEKVREAEKERWSECCVNETGLVEELNLEAYCLSLR